MAEKRIKTAQVTLRINPQLKSAAEKVAADDRRSRTSLIEKLLTDHLRNKGYLRAPRPGETVSRGARDAEASDMAASAIDERLEDKSASDEDRTTRKRRLIKGPAEFRDIRSNRPKVK